MSSVCCIRVIDLIKMDKQKQVLTNDYISGKRHGFEGNRAAEGNAGDGTEDDRTERRIQ